MNDVRAPQTQPADVTQLIHVARQPIFDVHGAVFGYELLFRGSLDEVEASQRDISATSQVIVAAFTEFGLPEVVRDRLCFINMTREFLVGDLTLPIGPEQVVLEVLESITIDDEVLAGVTALSEAGYRIALDDFVWGLGHDRLFSIASFVKLDLLDGDLSRLEETIAVCRRYPQIQLVAERLETEAHVAMAERYGCELRQGYALSRPHVLTTHTLSASKLRRLELLALLHAADTDMDKVSDLICTDPALAMRVLRASNSAAAGLPQRLNSVPQAVVLLGIAKIRQWAALMIASEVTGASEEQLTEALVRARFCHRLAPEFKVVPETAFLLGLLTGVADLTGMPREDLATQMPLADDLAGALRGDGSPLQRVLEAVEAYENGDIPVVNSVALGSAYLDMLRWSNKLVSDVAD
ncbi:HDOD domain-containing protein [Actinoplanes sichuanensis]|uniref:EAL and HDOD domain-containing protein n=1 Tax=Actinoplanes sichuanensis TaxID=512349 RepID=A0ABW4A6Q6_9ACTN|nr:HDOD domain-containing protein [Actinoplanes sichuanensis]BEL05112.1 HDOD domain-containing protein [Actinoplanes sichuanensis]